MKELFKQVYFDFKNIYDLSSVEKQHEIRKYWIENSQELNSKYIPILFDVGSVVNSDIIQLLIKNKDSLIKIISKHGDTAVQIFFLNNNFYNHEDFKHFLFINNDITKQLKHGAFSLLNDQFILGLLNKNSDKKQIKQNYLEFLYSTKKYMDSDFNNNIHYFDKCFKRLLSTQLTSNDLNDILFSIIDNYPEILKHKEIDNEYLTIYNNRSVNNILSSLKGKTLIPFIERYRDSLNLTIDDFKVLCSTVFIFSENDVELDTNISFLSNLTHLSKSDIIKNIFNQPDNDDSFYPELLIDFMSGMRKAKMYKNIIERKKINIKPSYNNYKDKFIYLMNKGEYNFNSSIKMLTGFSRLNFNISLHLFRDEIRETVLSLNSFVIEYLKELSIKYEKPISFNIFLEELKRKEYYSFNVNDRVEQSILHLYPYIEENYEILKPVFEKLKMSENFHNQYLSLESNKELKHIFGNKIGDMRRTVKRM